MTQDERFAKSFYLVHVNGTCLYPVRVKNRDTGRTCFRISKGGAGGNTKAAGQEVDDEETLFRFVSSGYAVRASQLTGGKASLYRVGDRAIRELVRSG